MSQNTLQKTVLLVDDEEGLLKSASLALRTSGFQSVLTCSDSRKVIDLLKENDVHVVVLDIMMPHLSGQQLLKDIVENHPELPVVMMSSVNEIDTVVQCMQSGAFDYLDKPVENLRLVTTLTRALDYQDISKENLVLKDSLLNDTLKNPSYFSKIITKNKAMISIFKYTESIASTSRAVLISGETGTGKELIAQSVHDLSGRQGEYVTVNVAGLDDNLFSDALFGHKKGAFTGAEQVRRGLIEKAEGGTLFLDEIGDLSIPSQVKLLRLLQEGEYYPLGSDTKKISQARIVVATSQNIRELVKEGTFRKDLYYRLQAHQIHLPPLRQRRDDLLILSEFFISLASQSLNKKEPILSEELFQKLSSHSFPGNIRELESIIFDAVSQHEEGELTLADHKIEPLEQIEELEPAPLISDHQRLIFEDPFPTIDEAVNKLVMTVLEKNNGNQTATAQELGITRQGLTSRLKRFHLK
jgi:DNA-binding NtrC family response regulator